MLTTPYTRSILRSIATLTFAASLGACSGDDDGGSGNVKGTASTGALVIITERESTDGASFHYLHALSEWPSSGELDDSRAEELGPPGVAFIQDAALYFYHAQAGEVEKLSVDDDLAVQHGDEISFVGYGISGFDAEPIRVSSEIAFFVDEKSAQIARWNPKKMEIDSVEPISADVLKRNDLKVQFQLGAAAGKRVFTTASWRNWDTNTVEQAAALGVFEQDSPEEVTIVEDDRCAPSVGISPFSDQDYVYLVSDGATGYDLLASPKKVDKPQCVVRMRADASGFDKDYFIDLQELTKSPAIFTAFPMSDHKLLVSLWSPDEDVSEYMTTDDAAWFWDRPSVYEYVIVDLLDKSLTKVEGLPLSSARSPKTLIVDDENYVQLFREDRGSSLYRVTADGKSEKVLDNPGGTNVQFLGRL